MSAVENVRAMLDSLEGEDLHDAVNPMSVHAVYPSDLRALVAAADEAETLRRRLAIAEERAARAERNASVLAGHKSPDSLLSLAAREVRSAFHVGPFGPNAMDVLRAGGKVALTPSEATDVARIALTAAGLTLPEDHSDHTAGEHLTYGAGETCPTCGDVLRTVPRRRFHDDLCGGFIEPGCTAVVAVAAAWDAEWGPEAEVSLVYGQQMVTAEYVSGWLRGRADRRAPARADEPADDPGKTCRTVRATPAPAEGWCSCDGPRHRYDPSWCNGGVAAAPTSRARR